VLAARRGVARFTRQDDLTSARQRGFGATRQPGLSASAEAMLDHYSSFECSAANNMWCRPHLGF
jgi:hypothetical protein